MRSTLVEFWKNAPSKPSTQSICTSYPKVHTSFCFSPARSDPGSSNFKLQPSNSQHLPPYPEYQLAHTDYLQQGEWYLREPDDPYSPYPVPQSQGRNFLGDVAPDSDSPMWSQVW